MASDEEPVELRKAVHTFCDATLFREWADACQIPVPTSIPRTEADHERLRELTAPREEAWKRENVEAKACDDPHVCNC